MITHSWFWGKCWQGYLPLEHPPRAEREREERDFFGWNKNLPSAQFSGLRGETIQLLIAYFSNHNLLGPVYLDLSAFCPCIGFLSYCLIWLHSIILLNQMLEEAVEIIGCEICSFKSCQFRFKMEDFLLMETQHTGFLNDELFLRFWAQIYFHSKIQH